MTIDLNDFFGKNIKKRKSNILLSNNDINKILEYLNEENFMKILNLQKNSNNDILLKKIKLDFSVFIDLLKKAEIKQTKNKKIKKENKKNKKEKTIYKIDDDDDDENDEDYEEGEEEENEEENEESEEECVDDDEEDGDDADGDDDDEDENEKIYYKKYKNTEQKNFFNELYKTTKGDSNNIISKYYLNLSAKDKLKSLNKLKEINKHQIISTPLLFKILSLDIVLEQKNHILKKYLSSLTSKNESSKLKLWIDSVLNIPFGKFTDINTKKIKSSLENLKKVMDDSVWGHDEAKRQIIQIMGQYYRNPKCLGSMIGIYGPPGNGKSTLVKEGIAKAMNKPFIFISLGGATDASFLEGHSYTYEGSVYGRIVNGLISCKCMDPIIYFDELDKISSTPKGDEITNILIHLTDPVQNSHFRDKYFHGVDIDLSKATMIFSFNNPNLVDKVLLDRITAIETKFLLIKQKIFIAQNYLLVNIIKDVGLSPKSVIIDDDIIEKIVNNYTNEGGVRKLKSLLYIIIRELNISNLIKTKINNRIVKFPFKLTFDDVKLLLKNKYEFTLDKINVEPKKGVVNGLFATSNGFGGILPIEVVWFPTTIPLSIKATGSLEKVIIESTQVACSLAWNYLDKEKQNEYLTIWKDKPEGFHIHCADASTSKDGPSAGAAITLALYSLFINKKIKNDVALTGEINLQGNITAIGGLEEKMEGAKKNGIKHVLIPKENIKDIEKIKERNDLLLDDTFKYSIIETFDDVIKYTLID